MTQNHAPLPPLPRYDADEVRRSNRLNALGSAMVQHGFGFFNIGVRADYNAPATDLEAFDIKIPQGLLHVIAPSALLNVWLNNVTSPVPVDVLLPHERGLLLLKIFAEAASAAETMSGVRPVPVPASPRPEHTLPFVITTDAGAVFTVRAALNAGSDAAEALFAAAARPYPPRSVPLTMTIVGDRRPFARRVLSTLRSGAVILMNASADPLQAPLGILGHNVTIPLRSSENGVTPAGLPVITPSPEGNVSEHPFAEVPVLLDFVMARLNVPADRLTQLNPGQVFDLEKPLEHAAQAMELAVNGRIIGRGELVQINNNYGVLVREVY